MASRVSPSTCQLTTSAEAPRALRISNKPTKPTCVKRVLIFSSRSLTTLSPDAEREVTSSVRIPPERRPLDVPRHTDRVVDLHNIQGHGLLGQRAELFYARTGNDSSRLSRIACGLARHRAMLHLWSQCGSPCRG